MILVLYIFGVRGGGKKSVKSCKTLRWMGGGGSKNISIIKFLHLLLSEEHWGRGGSWVVVMVVMCRVVGVGL